MHPNKSWDIMQSDGSIFVIRNDLGGGKSACLKYNGTKTPEEIKLCGQMSFASSYWTQKIVGSENITHHCATDGHLITVSNPETAAGFTYTRLHPEYFEDCHFFSVQWTYHPESDAQGFDDTRLRHALHARRADSNRWHRLRGMGNDLRQYEFVNDHHHGPMALILQGRIQ